MAHHILLTYVNHLQCTVFVDLDVLSLLRGSIHTVHHHDSAFFTGQEIFSLPDPVVQTLSCTSAPQQSLTLHMLRENAYVIFSFTMFKPYLTPHRETHQHGKDEW